MFPDIEDVIRGSYMAEAARKAREMKALKRANKKANLVFSKYK